MWSLRSIAGGLEVVCLVLGCLLAVTGSVPAALVVTTDNQNDAGSFTPTWTVAGVSLIAGLSPSSTSGDFQLESAGGLATLTDGAIGPVGGGNAALATAGNEASAGQFVTYTLPASAYGYDLTNVTVYSGWGDNGRDAQRYVVTYSTVSNPNSFIPLTSVDYNPPVADGRPSANRVVISDSAAGPIAVNVTALRWNFTPAVENGYAGYAEIVVQGIAATNVTAATIAITVQNQNSGSSFSPSWIIETDSLIQGQAPSAVGVGNFTCETDVAGVSALTDGTFGPVDGKSSYATCGSAAGQSVTYFVNNATLTNIVVYSGWPDQNRDGQSYNIAYSTVAAPTTFVPLTSVYHNPAVSGISANRVAIASSTGAPLATNVAFVRFDFTPQDAGTDYGYSGYAEIILQGTNATPSAPLADTLITAFPTSASGGADAALVLNEIMYHPATNEAGMEWIEFYNQLAVDLDISNWRVAGDTHYTFPAGTRAAGRSYLLLARDPAQLQAATGMSSNIFGPFLSPLNNRGGTLELYNHSGRLMDRVNFGTEDEWPVTPDGAGPSLAKIDPDWASGAAANWRASSQVGGTPGGPNSVATTAPTTLALNEVSGTTNTAFWVELMNYGTNVASLGSCILHHDGVTNTDYVFPPDITLAPGAFIVLSKAALGFKSPDSGEKLFLFGSNRTEVYDGLVLKKGPRARFSDDAGRWLVPNQPTPGYSNRFAFRTELVINEIMFNHKAFPATTANLPPQNNPEEWLELYNRGSNSVDPTGWTLSGGLNYQFAAGQAIAPGGYLVVARDAAAMRASYPSINLVGNYGGNLGSDDLVTLNDPLGNPANQVHYYGGGRWPESAAGGGSSLELRDPISDNSKAEAWAASKESGKSSWQTFTYRMVAQASATPAPDDQWHDFILGLLADGECWVDDISVIQSPTNNPVQLIANGDFEAGLAGWRVLGNHQRSIVDTDPDVPANHVLHLIASGPQEHMHNHIERTLAGGRAVTNGLLYEISCRARWIAGNHLLNTRLYFNRVARTTALSVPQLNGTPGAANSCAVTNIGPTFSLFQHQPVVPQSKQAVTIYARAEDPQGVDTCTLFWSVNGGVWSNTPMVSAKGVYAGIIPSLPTSSLVQFYVRATDGLGASSTYPAKGSKSGAFYRVNDGAANVALAHNLRILMSPANVALQYATTNLMSNENLPCTVIYDERQAYYDMSVRLKSSERGRVDAGRIGFHLEFNPDDLFRGVHPVMLLDRSTGGSRLPGEEMVLKHMVVQAGVTGVNSDYCQVMAPQSAQNGMAILSPRYEDNFVDGAFTNGGDGTLFEFELTYYPLSANSAGYKLPSPDTVQGVDISDLGDNKETYRYNFILKNHRSADDYATLINFARKWSLSGSVLDAQTQATMDMDEWLSAYAMVSLGGVADMYTFGGDHNLMTYIRPTDGRVLYFPWDMDFVFTQSATAPLVGNQNLSKIVSLPGNLRRFYAHIQDDISTTFNATYMAYWVCHYGAFSGQDYSADLSYITTRANYALSVINSAGGNTPFAVNGASLFTVTSNLVTLSGTAPVQITSLLINGISYPVTWNSVSAWTIQVPVSSTTNVLNIQAYDLHGNQVANTTRTAVSTGTVPALDKAIVINEIMCSPAVTNAEYVELFNTSSNANYDMSGWRLNGLSYTFPSGSVFLPNSFLVLVRDRVAYANAYGNTLPFFDQFDGTLDPNGETLTLFRPDGAQTNSEVVVDRVRYEAAAPWPAITNGTSLQLMDAAQDNSRVANWSAVSSNASSFLPQWVRVSATGIPRTTGISRPLYIYLQSAGDIYVDDVSVVAGAVAESGANLVTNGGFEASFAPWTRGSDGNNSASVVSSSFKHSGVSSLHLIATSAGSTQNSAIWEDFSSSLTVGATYTLSFWYRQSTNGGPLTVRFAGSGITITANPAPSTGPLLPATPAAANSVATTLPAFPSIWLNELQASNLTGLTNNVGARVPWIELFNPGTNVLSLAGLSLSDNYTNLTQWAFPTNSSVPANGFLAVWCDGQTNATTATAPHTNFRLASGTGRVALTRLLSPDVPQIVDYLNCTNLPANWSYGDFPDGQPFYRQPMFVATPRTFNTNTSPPITITINEWLADNGHTLANPAGGKFDDWFELFNPGTKTADLGGYYLTDDLDDKTKFHIPNNGHYLAPPGGHLLVWADSSGVNGTNDADLHASFALSKSGEALGLFAEDGTTIDAINFGAQTTDVSQGRFPDGANSLFAMRTPTPRAQNVIPNTAPILAEISNVFVHLGQTVQFTATATDAQSPYQNLTFSLTNAPAGAKINPTSGAFVWVTTNAIVHSTNSLTVCVTDNGTPHMSDARTFSVYVSPPPQFSGVNQTGDGRIQIAFGTLPGQTYQVQFKDSLTDSVWTSLGDAVPGNGSPVSVFDDLAGRPQRFFRLLVLP